MSDHGNDYAPQDREEARQLESERRRQLQLEARRNATPRFGPAVDGMLWSRIRPGEDDEEPKTPILGVLEFRLKHGIDMRHESGPPRRLWDAVLRYISSIPGCCSVEWGSRLDNNQSASNTSSILCLIHWDSTAAWRRFQHSLGFTPIIGLLDSDVSNRCAKLGPTGAPNFGCPDDAQERAIVVDVVSVTMAAEAASSPERRAAFEESWEALVASEANQHDGLQHSFAVWLEDNASTFFDPTLEEVVAAAKQAVFNAFLSWEGARYDPRVVEGLCDRLRALTFSQANMPTTTVSSKAIQLISQSAQPKARQVALQQPAARLNSLASILKAGVPQQRSVELANLREHAQQSLGGGISDARQGTCPRLFAAARGSFRSQGELYVGNTPAIPRWRRNPASFHGGYHCVDVVWMQLKARAPRSQGPRIHSQLKDQMNALPGFVKAFWARDVEHKARLAVLTVWEDKHARRAAHQDYRRILDDFAASSVHLAARLQHQALIMPRRLGAPWLDGWQIPYLEFISFLVPTGVVERQLFEHAYGAFIEMTEPSVIAGIPTACRVIRDAGGWQSDAVGNAEEGLGSPYQLFTGVLVWERPTARQEWYQELFRLACRSYELFGHQLDAMGILAVGGIEARFLELQRE